MVLLTIGALKVIEEGWRTNRRTHRPFRVGHSATLEGKQVLGTTMRGRHPIISEAQMGYLHHNKLDHTHFVYRDGVIIRKVRHTY